MIEQVSLNCSMRIVHQSEASGHLVLFLDHLDSLRICVPLNQQTLIQKALTFAVDLRLSCLLLKPLSCLMPLVFKSDFIYY